MLSLEKNDLFCNIIFYQKEAREEGDSWICPDTFLAQSFFLVLPPSWSCVCTCPPDTIHRAIFFQILRRLLSSTDMFGPRTLEPQQVVTFSSMFALQLKVTAAATFAVRSKYTSHLQSLPSSALWGWGHDRWFLLSNHR